MRWQVRLLAEHPKADCLGWAHDRAPIPPSAARHLKGRDQFIGWYPEQCRTRRALLANNARFLILPGHHLPNLASRVMKLVLERVSDD